jgi:hypothetical protein
VSCPRAPRCRGTSPDAVRRTRRRLRFPGCPGRPPPGSSPAFGASAPHPSAPRPREMGRGHGPPLDHDARARRDKPASRTSATLGAMFVLQSGAGEWRSGLDGLPFLWHRSPAELRHLLSSALQAPRPWSGSVPLAPRPTGVGVIGQWFTATGAFTGSRTARPARPPPQPEKPPPKPSPPVQVKPPKPPQPPKTGGEYKPPKQVKQLKQPIKSK